MILRAIFATVAMLWSGAATAQPHDMSKMTPMSMGLPPMPAIYGGQADKPGAPVFTGLGDHHMAITASPEAQKFFDQGVKLTFGFNHAEAIRSFRQAARIDLNCAMCWWGGAFSLGPNINMPMQDDAVIPAWLALQNARELADKVSPREQAWIAALARAEGFGDPVVDVAAPQGQARLAQHPGEAQGLPALVQVAPGEAQQLGNGRRPPFAPFEGHQG